MFSQNQDLSCTYYIGMLKLGNKLKICSLIIVKQFKILQIIVFYYYYFNEEDNQTT